MYDKVKFMFTAILCWIFSFSIGVKGYCQDKYSGETYAVIIGVADYQYMGLYTGDLRYTRNDAAQFAKFLKSPQGGNVPNKNIYFFVDKKARKNNIIHYAKKLFAKAKPNDRVIFFFSGHGVKGAFVPYDASSVNGISRNLLYFSDLKEIFKVAKCQTKLLFADACFSGSTLTDIKRQVHQQASNQNVNDSEIAFMMSCSDNEYSAELSNFKQGLFSYCLIRGMKGEADENKDGKITIWELHKYVNTQVRTKAKRLTGRKQTPITFGKFDKNMIVNNH